MSIPRVSVIIPVYNGQRVIEACLQSVMSQSFRNIEIIVVDDGSVDGTGEICKRYAQLDSRIIYFAQPNRGVSAARNAGLAMAQGEYLAFVDADDEVLHGGITALLQAAESVSADLVVGGYLVSRQGKDFAVRPKAFGSTEDFLCSLLNGSNHSALWNKLVRRESLGDIRFPNSIGYAEDKVFLVEFILQKNPSCFLIHDLIYTHNILHNESVTSSGGEALFELFASKILIGKHLAQSNSSAKAIAAFGPSAKTCVKFVLRAIDRKLLRRSVMEVASYEAQLRELGIRSSKTELAGWLFAISRQHVPVAVCAFAIFRASTATYYYMKRTFAGCAAAINRG